MRQDRTPYAKWAGPRVLLWHIFCHSNRS